MNASRVVLWWYDQTDMNLTGRVRGARDFSLDDAGLWQAREAAAALTPLEPSLIVSSPLARARQTTEAFSSLAGVDVEADDHLREHSFGLFKRLTGAGIEERLPGRYRAWWQAKEPEDVDAGRQADVGRRTSRAIEGWAAKTDGILMVASRDAAIKLAAISLLGEAPGEWMGLGVVSGCNWAILGPLYVDPPAWHIVTYNVGMGKSDEVRTPTQ